MSCQIEIYDDITGATFKNIMHQTENLEDGAEVELLISSYGGEILYCMSIIDALKRFHTKANVIGFACSAAAILAISCKECTMSENASMLIHSAWNDPDGDDPKDPGIKRCNDLQLSIIKNRCPDFNPKDIQKDTWLSDEDCLKLHLIDNIYITDTIDYLATCKRYAAKLSNIYNISKTYTTQEVSMDDKTSKLIEDVKEEKLEDQTEEPKVEEPENHDLIEVIEKLTEELNALKARVMALEEVKEDAKEETEIVAEGDERDEERERINNLYRSIIAPQACVAIGAPKAAAQKVVHKVDYKAFSKFIND